MTSGRTLATADPTLGSVSATYFNGIVQFAEACGASRARVLKEAAVAESDVMDADARLPLLALQRLFDGCATLLADPAFALRFGMGVPCAQLTLASALAAARPEQHASEQLTLRDALDGLNRYAALGVDFGRRAPATRYRFVESVTGVWLEDLRPDLSTGDAWPALTESVFARFATGIRRRGGEGVVRALEVRHGEPTDEAHRAAYHAVFRVPVHFGASRNALCLDPVFLENPLEPLATPVQAVLAAHADVQLRALSASVTWTRKVEAIIARRLTEAPSVAAGIDMEGVCRELAVSRHTLHRRLREECTTFNRVVDTVRHQAAVEMLREQSLPVAVVASRLGFSESAAFSRAYKRWTGTRPSLRVGRGPRHERQPQL